MNRSIIFNITIVFIISIISVAFGFHFFMKEDRSKYYETIKMKYFEVSHIVQENIILTFNEKELNKILKPHGVEYIKDSKDIIKKATILKDNIKEPPPPFKDMDRDMNFPPPFGKPPPPPKDMDKKFNPFDRPPPPFKDKEKHEHTKLLEYEGDLYVNLNERHFKNILLKELTFKPYNNNLKILFFLFIELIFILSYIFTIKKLLPLKRLKENIEKFGEGDFKVSFKIDSNDEIAEVANALQNSVIKIDKLINSRQLFLRNIMHELKTPITKGKVAIEFLEASKTKDRLLNVFNRMEILIKESAMVEEITSGQNRLNLKEARVVDLIDEAIDIAMIDRELIETIFNDSLILKVDFNFFAIAIKNLIDNGITYSIDKKVKVEVYKDKIIFINRGEKLKRNFNEYLDAFTKDNSKGLGLGLYIVINILRLHGFDLNYEHIDEKNRFSIIF